MTSIMYEVFLNLVLGGKNSINDVFSFRGRQSLHLSTADGQQRSQPRRDDRKCCSGVLAPVAPLVGFGLELGRCGDTAFGGRGAAVAAARGEAEKGGEQNTVLSPRPQVSGTPSEAVSGGGGGGGGRGCWSGMFRAALV